MDGRIKDNRGMTLVEMIVVIAIIGLMIVPLYNVMGTNDQVVKKTQDLANAKIIASDMYNYIEENIQYANQVIISDAYETIAGGTTSTSVLYMKDGELIHKKGTPSTEHKIYDVNYTKGFDVELFCTTTSDLSRMNISINVKTPSGSMYTLGPNIVEILNRKTNRPQDGIQQKSGNSVLSYNCP